MPGLIVLLLLALTLAPANALARASATGLRLGAHPDGITRLVLDLSESIDFSTALYADPYRVVVNTPGVTWATENGVKKPYGAVSGLRYDEDSLGGRIMIELKEPATIKSAYVIPPRDGLGWRFVMDLHNTTRAAFLAAAIPVRSAARAETQPERNAKLVPAPRPAVAVAVVEAPPPAAEPPRSLVVYSPEVAPPAPKAMPLPEPRPMDTRPVDMRPPEARPIEVAPVDAKPVEAKLADLKSADVKPSEPRRSSSTAAPIMSAPVPPPLERPAMALPEAAAPVVTKVSAPQPAPEPMGPKGLPADGKPVVVIDPGHGGVDPGAIGVSGIYEKYITLAVARELKAQLEKSGHYRVYLTRDRDVFIRLRDRVAIARQYNADLFISLHADSVGNPQLKGLSVYTLSQTSSDAEAQALADKENKADLIAGIDLSHESADVANILIDLAQRETMNRSAGFAGGVVEEVGREANLLGNTHRFAGFAVLKAPDVPSVLVEMGYLSNETEERNLRQPEHRVKLAKSISRAIDHFFVQGQKARRP